MVTSDKTFMGRDQELKWLAFSLYPLLFFLYCPFNLCTNEKPPICESMRNPQSVYQWETPNLWLNEKPPICVPKRDPWSVYQRETPNLCTKEKPPICVPKRNPQSVYQWETPNLCTNEQPPICVPMRNPQSVYQWEPLNLWINDPNLCNNEEDIAVFYKIFSPFLFNLNTHNWK